MDYTSLFYWLTVADNAKTFFISFIIIFTIIALISTFAYIMTGAEGDDSDQKMARKWMWWSYPFMILFWALFIFTPSKKDALLIVAGGQTLNFLTTDSTAQQIPHDVLNFVQVELRTMAKEAQVELGILNQRDQLIQDAKKLSTEELLTRMQTDTAFAKVLLDQ